MNTIIFIQLIDNEVIPYDLLIIKKFKDAVNQTKWIGQHIEQPKYKYIRYETLNKEVVMLKYLNQ